MDAKLGTNTATNAREKVVAKIAMIEDKIEAKVAAIRARLDGFSWTALPKVDEVREVEALRGAAELLKDLLAGDTTIATLTRDLATTTKSILLRLSLGLTDERNAARAEYALCLGEILDEVTTKNTEGSNV